MKMRLYRNTSKGVLPQSNDDTEENNISGYDVVNNPEHYTSGGIECIEAMESAYGTKAVMDFCKCNAFKYMWRFEKKNGIQDMHKAQ